MTWTGGGWPQPDVDLEINLARWSFPNKKYIIRRGLLRDLRCCLYFGSTATFGSVISQKPNPVLWVIDLTSEVTGWHETFNLGTNRCFLLQPTCSLCLRSSILTRDDTARREVCTYIPTPLGWGVRRKPSGLAMVKLSGKHSLRKCILSCYVKLYFTLL